MDIELYRNQLYDIAKDLSFEDLQQLCKTNQGYFKLCQDPKIKKLILEKCRQSIPCAKKLFMNSLFDSQTAAEDLGDTMYELAETTLLAETIYLTSDEAIILDSPNAKADFVDAQKEDPYMVRKSLDELLDGSNEYFPLGYWKQHPKFIIIWTSNAHLFAATEKDQFLFDINSENRTIQLKSWAPL